MNAPLLNTASALYRKQGEESLTKFMRLYLPHHVLKDPSEAHIKIHEKLLEITEVRGKRLAIAAPRDFGKSTMITLAFIIYLICYSREKFIVIISHTAAMACSILENVRKELTENPLFQRDFPDLYEQNGRPSAPRWKQNDIVTRNGIEILALGYEQQIRGRRHGANRPTLVILDDLEGEGYHFTLEAKAKMKRWLHSSVLKVGSDKTNFVFSGTVHHSFSLLKDYLQDKNPNWDYIRCKAVEEWPLNRDLWEKYENIRCGRDYYGNEDGPRAAARYYRDYKDRMDEGAIILWKANWTLCQLMEMYADNPSSFMGDMQNEPVDVENMTFDVENFHYWSDEYPTIDALLKALGPDVHIFGACDPAMSKKMFGGDYSAILIVARKNRDYYVLVADISRPNPEKLIKDIVAYAQRYRLAKFIVEDNGFQELVAQNLERAAKEVNITVPLHRLTNKGDKKVRIFALYPWFKNGTLKVARWHKMLLDQLQGFPEAKHDDGPDALEMLIRIANQSYGFEFKAFIEMFKQMADSEHRRLGKGRQIIRYDGKDFNDPHGLMDGAADK